MTAAAQVANGVGDFVARTRKASDVPERVEDLAVIALIAAILRRAECEEVDHAVAS